MMKADAVERFQALSVFSEQPWHSLSDVAEKCHLSSTPTFHGHCNSLQANNSASEP
jgi:hypothetical protein